MKDQEAVRKQQEMPIVVRSQGDVHGSRKLETPLRGSSRARRGQGGEDTPLCSEMDRCSAESFGQTGWFWMNWAQGWV